MLANLEPRLTWPLAWPGRRRDEAADLSGWGRTRSPDKGSPTPRVSSLDQRADRQLDGITVDRTFTDSASGKDTHRPQLAAMLGFVREGDIVIVHSMASPAISTISAASA